MIDTDTATRIAAEPDPDTRTRLLHAATGHHARTALAHLEHTRDLLALAADLGIGEGDLDDAVHTAFGKQAASVNNGGTLAQLALLTEGIRDRDAIRALLENLRP
ncbi:hypothetical protein OG948_59265 (plasmid) [Embleya sp. NBC_00888]|uniref:hypothetical protein n=1 Tax=Embleya sp. NBC_00888 TaxID=2975960 RepID=UPI002F91B33E|nr:hypothetical protein OG948_59265 [Embleya sp. NBC_00888]